MSNALDLMNLSHHAYCLIGGDARHEGLLASLKNNHKIGSAGNPDFFDRKYQNFTIDDARELKSRAETRPVTSTGKKIFILMMNGITVEAQNALLKLLEEPNERSHFFLIIPSAHLLLSTVKSRVQLIGFAGGKGLNNDETLKAAKNFIDCAPQKRLDLVKALMDEITKEKKTKQDAIDFLNALQESIHEKGVKKNVKALESVLLAGKYANDRAPSMKMLLEYVALSLS